VWEQGTLTLKDRRTLAGAFQIHGSTVLVKTGSIASIPLDAISDVSFSPPAVAREGDDLVVRQRFAEAAAAYERALQTSAGAGDPYLRIAAERARQSSEEVAVAAAAVPVAILAGDHRAVLDAVTEYVAIAHPERLEPAWASAVCTAWTTQVTADPRDRERWRKAALAAGIDLGVPCPPAR
jgi:hypothetical protein